MEKGGGNFDYFDGTKRTLYVNGRIRAVLDAYIASENIFFDEAGRGYCRRERGTDCLFGGSVYGIELMKGGLIWSLRPSSG